MTRLITHTQLGNFWNTYLYKLTKDIVMTPSMQSFVHKLLTITNNKDIILGTKRLLDITCYIARQICKDNIYKGVHRLYIDKHMLYYVFTFSYTPPSLRLLPKKIWIFSPCFSSSTVSVIDVCTWSCKNRRRVIIEKAEKNQS